MTDLAVIGGDEEPDTELEQLVFRRARTPSPEQREEYLELIYEGVPHVLAARKVGSSGSAFKALRRRDIAFAKQCEQADARMALAREERLQMHWWDLIEDRDHPRHWQALQLALEAMLPEMSHKRVKQIQQQIDMHSAVAATMRISVEELQAMPQDKLDFLIQTLQEAGAEPRVIEG